VDAISVHFPIATDAMSRPVSPCSPNITLFDLINVDSHDVENQADNVANALINPSISSLNGTAFDPFTWLAIAPQTIGLASGNWNLHDKINEIMSKNSSAEEKQKEIFEFIEKCLAELETAVAEKENALIYKDGALAAFEMSFDKAMRTGYGIGYGDASAGIARRPEYTAAVVLPQSLAPNTGNLLVPTSNVSTQSLVGGLPTISFQLVPTTKSGL
jgi:hypothetical protein